ncbi:homodimeric glycerol 3-phosphate dehydrogenase (quinone) [Pseudoxanthobacter soli DSM 19599]|uniref:Glycerol-3-phosphate dehydrogenase n=1 Tax=Pseudoxanthobacter soli DSM 19599 TaxID=1123029 RepID=A0A1M7ZNT9_9HYPH|nr:glycerol-3-phosphate dehydrogenase [Pseudoxanthobacter soli]SHO66590.1 homodimeric glycerol 3-phosphate dehydrogenase (quinone) [Pseudoxanthobacter soli DSM 19599]
MAERAATQTSDTYDLAIIGGGINGCGIARDAAGRGLKVFLCDRGDLGGATSSASTKLLHGGLRYLEHYEFRLVREALKEREVLWGIAPHIVRPLRFVLPHVKEMRPRWMLRLGLLIYDHLGGRKALPGTSSVDFARSPIGQGLKPGLRVGFEYSDCWVEDNRLVILNARDARRLGAEIRSRTACVAARTGPGGWTLTVEGANGARRDIRAPIVVNAAGPWAGDVVRTLAGRRTGGRTRMVQGSHIVVPKLYDHDRCFIFQNGDGRIVFTIPYEGDFTLIGTTDRDYSGDLDRVRASEDEIHYLCRAASAYFSRPIAPADVVWTYSGVRPLYDDGASAAQAATRDYVLELDQSDGAPMLSIFGGKITTYRRLAESALDKIEPLLDPSHRAKVASMRGWTGRASLPGGDFPKQDFPALVRALAEAYPFLPPGEATRFVRYYGTEAPAILGHARKTADLGQSFGAGLTEAEIDHMRRNEWALTSEDILWRRSKLGLRLRETQAQEIDRYLTGLSQVA